MNAPPTAVPRTLYEFCVWYLLAKGWYRDGDDPGIWHQGGSINPPGESFTDALAVQWVADGIDFAWTT